MFTKLGREEVLMAPHMFLGFSSDQALGGSKAWQKYVNKGFKELLPPTGRLH